MNIAALEAATRPQFGVTMPAQTKKLRSWGCPFCDGKVYPQIVKRMSSDVVTVMGTCLGCAQQTALTVPVMFYLSGLPPKVENLRDRRLCFRKYFLKSKLESEMYGHHGFTWENAHVYLNVPLQANEDNYRVHY